MATPTPDGQALPADTRLEEFVIERVLGSGGFGITYLARDVRLGRQVVIKENLPVQFCFRDTHSLTVAPRHLDGEDEANFRWSLENFSKEAALLASLDHPGIVKVLRSFEANGTAYFVMPFVEGLTFDALIAECRAAGEHFSETELRGLLTRVLDALASLHERGICHRDIKPGNILVTTERVPVLIDFGSARQRLSERSMTVIESPGYTPFEQLQSHGNVGPWSDLYALGGTLYKALTFEVPPKANDQAFGDPLEPLAWRADLLARYSKDFLGSVDRALAVLVEDRCGGAREWRQALDRGASGQWKLPGRLPTSYPQPNDFHGPVVEGSADGDTPPPPAYSGGQGLVPKYRSLLAAGGVGLAIVLVFIAMQPDRSRHNAIPQAKPPDQGCLLISTDPPGAMVVEVGGAKMGITPLELKELSDGIKWRGRVELAGYRDADLEADVSGTEPRRLPVIKLEALPQKAIITSIPAGAEIWDGATKIGRTPWEEGELPAGREVQYDLRKEGYKRMTLAGKVAVGRPLALHGDLEPLPQDVSIRSFPAGAEVWDGTRLVGTAPCVDPARQPGTTVAYRLRLGEFEDGWTSGKIPIGAPLDLAASLTKKPKEVLPSAGDEKEFVIAGGTGMRFCWVPPGQFVMGSPPDQMPREDNEAQVPVRISHGFWLGKYEVTRRQWREVMRQGSGALEDESIPVTQVGWWDICGEGPSNRGFLGNLESVAPAGWRFVLPTEAQWEYACRAGSEGAFSGLPADTAWFDGNSDRRIHAVGTRSPNGWGLHDLQGNVAEWCRDSYSQIAPGGIDPWNRGTGARVVRGATALSSEIECRSARRGWLAPSARFDALGFRLALVPSSLAPRDSRALCLIFKNDFTKSGNATDPLQPLNRCFSFGGGATFSIEMKDRSWPTKEGVLVRFRWLAPYANLEQNARLQMDVFDPKQNRMMFQPAMPPSACWRTQSIEVRTAFDAGPIQFWNKWKDVPMHVDEVQVLVEVADGAADRNGGAVADGDAVVDPFLPLIQRSVTAEEITGWDLKQLRYAINYLYARHGFPFEDAANADIRRHFEGFLWYKPVARMSMEETDRRMTPMVAENIKVLATERAKKTGK